MGSPAAFKRCKLAPLGLRVVSAIRAVRVTWVGVLDGAKVGLTVTVPMTGSAPEATAANAINENTIRFGMGWAGYPMSMRPLSMP